MPRNRGTRAEHLRPAFISYDDLPDIQPVGAGDWVRWCNFAYPGWGKTSAWGTAADAGMNSLIIRSSLDVMPSRIMQSGIKQYIADNWEQMYKILDFLRMANHGYTWVFWDNVSIHQDVLLDDVWEGTIAANPRRAYLLGDNGQPIGPNLSPSSGLDRGEYGRNMERIQQWVRHMVGCNSFHFGIGAHPYEGQHPTNDEGGALLRPYVQGKLMTEKLCGYCNIVTFMELMEGQDEKQNEIKWRRLHFQESSRYYAKDLYDAFPKGYFDIVTDTPTIPTMMSAIEKARGKGLGASAPSSSRRGRRRN